MVASHRLLLVGFAAAAAASAVLLGAHLLVLNPQWNAVEWLISYDAGFVRRGLSGWAAHGVARAVSLPPLALIAGSLSVVWVGTVAGAVVLFRQQHDLWSWRLVVASPLLLTFPVYDAGGALRKEVLGLAVLVAAALVTRFWADQRRGTIALIVMVVALAPVVLTHELLALLLVHLLLLARLHVWTAATRAAMAMAVAAVSVATAAAVTVGRADASILSMCEHWRDVPASVVADCASPVGAVDWLTYDTADALALMGQWWPSLLSGSVFAVPLIALAFLPLRGRIGAPAAWPRWQVRASVALLVGSHALLLTIAHDWGRYLHTQFFAAVVTLLACRPIGPPVLSRVASRRDSVPERHGAHEWWAVVAYATLWSVPHSGSMFSAGLVSFLAHRLG